MGGRGVEKEGGFRIKSGMTDGDKPGITGERATKRRLGPQAMAAFIGAIEEGATIARAAKAAGCSRQTAYDRRKADEGFRAAWDEAVEKSNRPWLISMKNKRQLQKWKPRPVKFTDERKEAYLEWFAATCDSDEAARRAGVGDTTVYTHRRTDPEFAAAWADALDQGYARLEAELARQRLAAAARMKAAVDGASGPDAKVEFEQGLALLKRYDTRRGRPEPFRRMRARPSFDEAMTMLEKKLMAMGYEIDEDSLPALPDDDMPA